LTRTIARENYLGQVSRSMRRPLGGLEMDFGTFHLFESIGQDEQTAIADQIDLMVAAEDHGFSSVWAAEHHFSDYGLLPSPVLGLAAVARSTSTIRLGTGIVVLPFHNPIRVAEELAFLDNLSAGRLEVGVGRGYRPRELDGFGVKLAETRSITNEALEVIRQAWTLDEVDFHGAHFDIDRVPVRPKPVQRPHPRVYLGSLSPETFPLVGQLGVNLLFTPTFRAEEDIPAQVAQYRTAVREHGDDPANRRIGALRMVYVADTNERAREEFGTAWERFHMVTQAQNALRPGRGDGKVPPGHWKRRRGRESRQHSRWRSGLCHCQTSGHAGVLATRRAHPLDSSRRPSEGESAALDGIVRQARHA
jgi:alkanesulfonate monooxygenase SsuD/methylene tetrahydromethanopterin reductase-like flavin-dependent oxidoreductase (luciferase family)